MRIVSPSHRGSLVAVWEVHDGVFVFGVWNLAAGSDKTAKTCQLKKNKC
jgi:hypothetical protein